MKNIAIILGGGTGKRFKGEIPKQFLLLGEMPIIIHTIGAFQRAPSIDAILIVVPGGWEQRCMADLKTYPFDKVQRVITGGATRQLSCWKALQYLDGTPPALCVVHDAARPLVTKDLIESAVQEGSEGMTFGLRARDTITECRDGEIIRVYQREQVYQIQTPQVFPFAILLDAHRKALEAGIRDASDDAGLVLRAGYRVKIVEGDPRNIKITDSVDLAFAQHLLPEG